MSYEDEQNQIAMERTRLADLGAEEGITYSDDVLNEAVELLGTALSSWRNREIMNGVLHPIVRHAMECIEDCALDSPDELYSAVLRAADGDTLPADRLLNRYVREYAESHLSTLVEYFHIDTEDRE
jgi:hypothetical protein